MTRQTKKSNKAATKKPIVNAGVRQEMHVRDCMVWLDPTAAKSEETKSYQPKDKVLPSKPELGKALDRGYTTVEVTRLPEDPRDTALEAIRGWPNDSSKPVDHQTNEFDDFMNGLGVAGAQGADPYKDYAITPRKEETGNNKKKGKQKSNAKLDPNLHDLISHRFMYEAAMERQRKAAEKEREEAEMAKLMRSKRFPKDIKANKTSQLRSIAMAEKVETNAKELWQMPKFKNNSKSALNTKRHGEGKRTSTGGRGARVSGVQREGHPTCTCAEENTGYKGADYDRYQEPDYPNVDYDDTKGAEKVSFSPKEDEIILDGEVLAL